MILLLKTQTGALWELRARPLINNSGRTMWHVTALPLAELGGLADWSLATHHYVCGDTAEEAMSSIAAYLAPTTDVTALHLEAHAKRTATLTASPEYRLQEVLLLYGSAAAARHALVHRIQADQRMLALLEDQDESR